MSPIGDHVQSAVKVTDHPEGATGELLTEDEEKALADRFEPPEMYFNEETFAGLPPAGGNQIDFIKAALGSLKIKPRRELTENFQAWLVQNRSHPAGTQYSHSSRTEASPAVASN
jgi:hypothetical protein